MPFGRTWVSGGVDAGPPRSCIRAVRLIACSSAWRNFTFPIALLLFGEMVLKSRYGLLLEVRPRLTSLVVPACICASRPGTAPTGGQLLNSMPPLGPLVCSTSWLTGSVPVSVTLIALTYALRIPSVDASQAG